jgi:hypothetical protein
MSHKVSIHTLAKHQSTKSAPKKTIVVLHKGSSKSKQRISTYINPSRPRNQMRHKEEQALSNQPTRNYTKSRIYIGEYSVTGVGTFECLVQIRTRDLRRFPPGVQVRGCATTL